MAAGDRTYRASYGLSLTASVTTEVSDSIDHKNEVKLRTSGSLSATTSPPVNALWGDDINLTAGAYTLDLTSLTGASMPDTDFTGKKLQIIGVECPATNSGVMKFSPGAANGYNFMGDSNDQLTIGPGGSALVTFSNNLDDITASAKTIDVAGTGTEQFNITLVAG